MDLFQLKHISTQAIILLQISSEDHRLIGLVKSTMRSYGDLLASTGEKDRKPEWYLNIVDCRGTFPDTLPQSTENFALITPEMENRLATFATGFTDFICWPIVPAELYARLFGKFKVCPPTQTPYLYSRISLVEKICSYITADIKRPISIRQLAKTFNSNHNTINRLFNQELGMPPAAWQRKLRLEGAAVRLIQTDDPITGIAAEFGYPSPNNFATAFKRHFGMTPLEYRKNETRRDRSERGRRN